MRRRARIDAAGAARFIASSRTASGTSSGNPQTTHPTTSTFDSAGALVVGTGRNGKLYSLSGDPTTATLLMQASAQQVTGFARDAKGNIYLRDVESRKSVQALAAARGRGHLHVARARRADGRRLGHAQLARVGARGQPRRRVHAIRQHGNAGRYVERVERARMPRPNGEEIKSPNARYLQWKAVLTGKARHARC